MNYNNLFLLQIITNEKQVLSFNRKLLFKSNTNLEIKNINNQSVLSFWIEIMTPIMSEKAIKHNEIHSGNL